MAYTPFPIIPGAGSGGGGSSVHNDLAGRSAADAHPTSAITGLSAALAAAGNVDSVNGETGVVVLDAADVGAAPTTRTVGTGLATTGTVNLDMAAVHGTIQTITLTGNPTFTTSNRAAGREVTLVLAAGGSSRTLAWPSWLAVGAALPTSLASGKSLVVSVTCTDTTDAAAIAASAVQP